MQAAHAGTVMCEMLYEFELSSENAKVERVAEVNEKRAKHRTKCTQGRRHHTLPQNDQGSRRAQRRKPCVSGHTKAWPSYHTPAHTWLLEPATSPGSTGIVTSVPEARRPRNAQRRNQDSSTQMRRGPVCVNYAYDRMYVTVS